MDEHEKRTLTAFNTGGALMGLSQAGLNVAPLYDGEGNYRTEILLVQGPPFRNVVLSVRLEDEDA